MSPSVFLKAYTPDPCGVIESAAAFCYDSKPRDDYKITKNCVESGHDSVTEHATFTFAIYGISRACLAQLTRHRIGTAYSVRSQRYCNESEFGFVTPPTIRHDKERAEFYGYIMGEIRRAYSKLIDMGVPKEDARFVLPNACETALCFSINVRAFIHLCNLRLCTRAQWEIRELVAAMVAEVLKVCPELKPYLVPNCERYGFCPEKRGCGNHPSLAEMLKHSEASGYFEAMRELNSRGELEYNNGRGIE